MKSTAQTIIDNTNPMGNAQMYASHLKGGALLETGKTLYNTLFGLSVNDSSNPYAKVLTNLDNAGRLADSESFRAYQYGFRLWKLGDGVVTDAEAAAMTQIMSASRVKLFIGPNSTKVLDIELAHFNSSIQMAKADGDNSVGVNTLQWLQLPAGMEQDFKENMNFRAELEVELPAGTPAALGESGDPASPQFVFNFLAAGRRIVV